MNERYEEMYQAASRYYIQGETMESIAHQMGLSRSTVSRLLHQARATGLVRISLADDIGSRSPMAAALNQAFGVRVHLVSVRDGVSEHHRLEQVARMAARLLCEAVADHNVIGVAWGGTTSVVVRHLQPRPLEGAMIVQLNGGTNRWSSGIPYVGEILQRVGDAFRSQVVYFPVPAFFDYAETKQAMWRERSVQRVVQLQHRMDVAIFGVGCLEATVPSHVYTSGYMDDEEMRQLVRDGVVGDVATVLLREDGSWTDIPLNARASGLNPTELARVPRRFCVVADPSRARAIVGALRAGTTSDLVIDEGTARAVLDRL